jgi:hypothetical protein
MSLIQTETLLEDLKVLLIAQPGKLVDLIGGFYQDQQVEVETLNLDHDQCLESLKQTVSNDFLQNYYKIVAIFDFPALSLGRVELCKEVVNILQSSSTSQVYLAGITSKVDATSPLFQDWKQQTTLEDNLISHLYEASFPKKIILGQDLIYPDDETRSSSYPIKFLTQAIPNGYLLNPQQEFYLQSVDLFFSAVSKELIKPGGYNFLVRGGKYSSDELCSEIKLIYQSTYQKELEIISVDAISPTRLEKKPDVVEVALEKENSETLRNFIIQTSSQHLGVEPSLLDDLLTQNQPILKTSMVLSNSSWNKFEPSGVVKDRVVDENKVDDKIVLEQPQSKPSQQPFSQEPPAKQSPPPQQPAKKSPPPSSSFELTPNQVSQSVNKIFSKRRVKQKTERRSVKATLISRIKKKSKRKKIVFAGGFLLLILGVSLATLVGILSMNFGRSQLILEQNIDNFLQGNHSSSQEIDEKLIKQADFLNNFLDIHLIQKSRDLVRVNQQLTELSQEIVVSQQYSMAIFDHLFLKTPRDLLANGDQASEIEDLDKSSSASINQLIKQKDAQDRLVFEKLSLFFADLEGLPMGNFSVELDDKFTRILSQLKEMRAKSLVVQQVNQLLPDLIGLDRKQVYYLLLQDERELRPTGGFIEGLVMIVVDDGRIIDWQVFSSSQIDNKVLGRVSSPSEIQSFLGEEYLHFRDANWDPDFRSTSQRLEWFIKEALNQPADGIIGINYNLIKDVLAITGDIKVEGQQEAINSWNLYNRLELALTEGRDNPGAADLPTSLLSAIFEQLPRLEDSQKNQFFETLFQSLRDKQMLVYLKETDLSSAVGQLGWAGSLISPECPSGFGESCVVDEVFQVESNIGVNKVNSYVNQTVSHSIEIEPEKISHQRLIKFTNKARSNIWPLGPYKFYIRFYVNAGANLEKIEINGELVAEEKILNYLDHNKKVFGVVAEVGVDENLELGLHYSTPLQIEPGKSYFFYDQLQAGVKKRPTVISLKHPLELVSVRVSPQVDVNNNQIVVTSDVGSSFVVVKFE